MHATFDFETASEAGYVWDETAGKWQAPRGSRNKGLPTVGTVAYSEHPSTRVLVMRYKLPALWFDQNDSPRAGGVVELWRPLMAPPKELLDFLAAGGLLEAHNLMFEFAIWQNVCVPKYGWPSLEPYRYQLRCSMAKARANSYPGSLDDLGDVLQLATRKDADGKRLLKKFSMPRDPTKKDPRVWVMPEDDPEDAKRLDDYCATDVLTEEAASAAMPPMSDDELIFWMVDQEINWRGLGIDRQGVNDCIAVLEEALEQYGDEYREITGGLNPTQLEATKGWLRAQGVYLDTMDEEALDAALGPGGGVPPHPPGAYCLPRRVLEIRQLIGSASVKKLYAMSHQACRDDRLRNLIIHHGARTGRPTGEGPQPLNLPKAGPSLRWCGGGDKEGEWLPVGCRRPFKASLTTCPWCAAPAVSPVREWSVQFDAATGEEYNPADTVLEVMRARSLAYLEMTFGDALLAISGCIRGLFVAAPGHELIASDYSAIEAVVTAMLSGEEWRIEAFRQNKPIYLMSAAKITGKTLEFYEEYRKANGSHHPDRQHIGKVSELAGGFGGWVGAWRAFGFEGTDDEAKEQILAWRAASPSIVQMWGGQTRRGRGYDKWPERYGFEGAAVNAIANPGQVFTSHGIRFERRRGPDRLIITLLSGRELTYHEPKLTPSPREWSPDWEMAITYMTWNTNPKYGPRGWVPMSTYGGRLTENIVQATAHDILRYAILQLRAAGYPTVLHVYDEIVVEVPKGLGSVEEVERIMSTMPPWAHDWPVRASGGWRGWRYRK